MPYKDKEKQREYQRQWANANGVSSKSLAKRLEWLREQKNKPCTDCKKEYPYYVMQFDHIDEKNMNLSKLIKRAGLKRIQHEVSLCELVCANCHAIRTWERRQRP